MAAPSPLLATKLAIPPARSNVVARPRLFARLNAGLREDCRLILLSAPAGFGKTTLVTQWLSHRSLPAAWLSLDADDNDPNRFLACLAAAARRLNAEAGEMLEVWLQSPQPPSPGTFATALVNALGEVTGPCLLVLDDYHVIAEADLHKALGLLVEHLSPAVRLVLLTRADPPLPLARMRARGKLAELRVADLRFAPDEAAAFLTRVMRLPLSSEAVGALERRTEGWITGLQLAALSLQSRDDPDAFIAGFSGSHHFIIDYLTEEVLNCQPAPVLDFLMRTSILERLCAPLCDALLNDGGAAVVHHPSSVVLNELERANLFLIPLDDERRWYRYHHLFADLLRSRLQRERPDLVPELHRCASHWLAQSGDPEAAMKHALSAPDLGLAADLAESHLPALIRASRIATGLQWLRQIPEALIASRAYLSASCGWAYCINGQAAAAERCVQAGEAALPQYERIFDPLEQRWIGLDEVRGQLTAVRAYCARQREDFAQAITLTKQALRELPESAQAVRSLAALNLAVLYLETGSLELSRRACLEALEIAQRPPGNLYASVTALSMLAASAFYQGQLGAAADWCRQAIALGTTQAGQALPVQAVGYAHGWLAAVHDQRNEMADAERHLDIAAELVELIGPQESIVYSHLYRARLALDVGDLRQAQAALQRAEGLMQVQSVGGNIRLEWLVNRSRLHLLQGEVEAAEDLLARQGVAEGDLMDPNLSPDGWQALAPRLPAYLQLARVRLARTAVPGDRACELLERIGAMAEASRYVEVLLETLALQSVAADKLGDRARALGLLGQALAQAAPEGWRRPILNAGKPLVPLLRQAVANGVQAPLVISLLDHLAGPESDQRPPGPRHDRLGPKAHLVEPLTERELEVLRLIAEGLSNLAIAGRLVITVGTVKAHTSSIYGKLGVNTRTQAVARAQSLGLL